MKPTRSLPAFPTIAIKTTPWANAWRLRQINVACLLNEGGLAQIPTDLQGFGVRFGVEWFSNMVATKGTAAS